MSETTGQSAPVPVPVLDAIGIICDDVGATLDFYGLLGFELPEEREGHVEIVLPSGLRLMFDDVAIVQSFSDWTPPTGGDPRLAIALLCDSPAAVDALHARVVAAGHTSKVDPFDAPWGQRYATVVDPAGTSVDLFAGLR